MNITCRKTCCRFNNSFVCMAKGLEIKKGAQCNTFEKCDDCAEDTTRSMLKKPPKYHRFRPVRTLPIDCKAKCQFNKEGKCIANGITINDVGEVPVCITFFTRLRK